MIRKNNVLVTEKSCMNSDRAAYSFINPLSSTDISLIILSVCSLRMFIITIAAVAVVVYILLFYLYLNKMGEKCRQPITINS